MLAALPSDDLDLILSLTPGFWQRFAGARLFLTGGTGFIGRWLVQSVQHANDRLDAGIELAVLTRSADRARQQSPRSFARADTRLIEGDVAEKLPAIGGFDLCIHAATDVGDSLQPAAPVQVFDTIVGGTRRVLDASIAAGAQRFLLASSGAVYGPQPATLDRVPESAVTAPRLDPQSAYGNGKRAAEWLANAYTAQAASTGLSACSARIFALVGPGLPLNAGFAAGNFIRDVLAGQAVNIQGDGRALRSYLYMADLSVWLLRMLESGAPGTAYNAGSRHAVSIAELAHAVVDAAGVDVPVRVALAPDHTTPAARYVPDTQRAHDELGLDEYTPLAIALKKTIAWNR
jgi:nucleoside-diphosphate-sugar epimerase